MAECYSCGQDVVVFANKTLGSIGVLDARPTQVAISTVYYIWEDDNWRALPARNQKEDAYVKVKYRGKLHVPHIVTCAALKDHFLNIEHTYEKNNPKT